MIRSPIAGALLLAAILCPAANADNRYSDPEGRFNVNIPEGWQAGKPDGTQIALAMIKAEGKELLGLCVAIITETPATKSKSQAEIDAATTAEMTKQFWENTYKALGTKDVVIAETGSRDQDGRKVQSVTVEFSAEGAAGKTMRMKGHEEVHAIPGRIHDIGCSTYIEKYDSLKTEFNSILASYMPQSGLVASTTSSRGPVATLFANANFNGMARVVVGDTPSVTNVSWPTQTGSLSIAGAGEWQVCEGANYTGNCMVVAGAHAAPLNDVLHIGSLRPYQSLSEASSIANAVKSGTSLLLREQVRRLTH